MGRRRSEPEYDAGAEAIRALEDLTGRAVPDEGWRRKLFVLDAKRELEGLRDRVEEAEGGVDDLESERDMLKEQVDELKDFKAAVKRAKAGLEDVKAVLEEVDDE